MDDSILPKNFEDGYLKTNQVIPEGPQIRPWVRYWARIFDVYLFSTVLGLMLGLVVLLIPDLEILSLDNKLLAVFILVLWVIIETLLLSTWGFTPGKYLFNIYVRDSEMNKLKVAPAFARSIAVMVMGLGCGIPLASLITLILSHSKLLREGKSKWDSNGNFVVIHRRIGAIRTIIAVISFIALFGVMFISVYADI